jgi:predicted CxxxxCH...CXXCH cytochrome family protein
MAALPACHKVESMPPLEGGCRSCHGSNSNAAPPKAVNGDTDTGVIGVGAHQVHVLGGPLMHPVACQACHVVPKNADDPGHMDHPLPAYIIWGDISKAMGANATWDHGSATCTNTYCHGATLTGGSNTSPVWTKVDGSQAACGACHGLPPPAPHPQSQTCENCHAPIAGPNLSIADPARHADGVLDVKDTSQCSSCHGSTANSAPPHDTSNKSDTSLVTVGAHQTHLLGGASSAPVACTECHIDVMALNTPGHIDHPPPATITWGDIAKSGGSSPAWDHNQATCANTYCHGSSMVTVPGKTVDAGGRLMTPKWTAVDGTQAACGTCHGLPPPAPHPQNERCELCHAPTAGPNQTIANRMTHVDGVLQVAADTCQAGCHGSMENLAPPLDTLGKDLITSKGVGAHQTHMSGGHDSAPVACDSCHVVPMTVNEPGHMDHPLPAYVKFHGNALVRSAQPTWDEQNAKCNNTYCHGQGLSGGSNTSPTWTIVDGSQSACGSCHGLPPTDPQHPQSDRCELCHAPTAGPNKTIANAATHINGVLDVQTGDCTHCHGSAGTNPAPPKNTTGSTKTASIGVGAHQSHLLAVRGLSRPVDCIECHIDVTAVDTPGHIDHPLPAKVVWGPLASHTGVVPTWDHNTATCANVYCHGTTLLGGTLIAPTWTTVDGTQSACGSCHGLPPPAPHPQNARCEICHQPTAGPNQTIAGPSTHIDGTVQVASGCTDCHGAPNVNQAPPKDTTGSTKTASIGVGAHQIHLAGGQFSKAVPCNECHTVPAAVNSPGHIDHPLPAYVIFGGISTQNNHTATWTHADATCTNTYCHGGQGASVPDPVWNKVDGSQAPCGGCHGIPPPTPVHNGATDCTGCHQPTAGPNKTIANPATHVDGIVQASQGSCNGTCHGGANTPAPPKGITGQTANTDPAVGAHAVHLAGGSVSAPVACNTCHTVPVNVTDPGHNDHPPPAWVIFSGMASANLTTPTFNATSVTCTNTYCHGSTSSGGTNTAPVWNQPGTAPCGSCHGLPPNPPHPQVTKCEVCHADAGPNHTIIDRTKHLNGSIDVNDLVPCQDCHGSAMNAAPPLDLAGTMSGASVGAHQVHMAGTPRSLAVPCAECHIPVNASSPNQAGHYDHPLPATMTFGPLASSTSRGAQTPSYTVMGTCTNYCHGATLPSGTMTNISWQTVGPLACNSCHGMPPADTTHGNGTATNCAGCHTDDAGPNQTITNPSKHIDGVVEVSSSCNVCHGSMTNSAPPNDTRGASVGPKVGVHQQHLSPTIAANPVPCTDCHVSVTTYNSPGHVDHPYPANVIFSGIASNSGLVPAYDYATETCSNTYCHGATLPGGKTAVVFSDTSGADAQCTGCHGMPPPDSTHTGLGATSCNTCHTSDTLASGTIDPAKAALHVDGIVQVSGGGCTSCHPSPPTPTNQNYANGGGAHLQHTQFNCDACHPSDGAPGHNQGGTAVMSSNVELTFTAPVSFPGGTTTTNGGTPSYNRATQTCLVGCHNPIVNNPKDSPALTNAVTWTQGAQTCVNCHKNVAQASPRNHNVGAGDAGCLTCHNMTGHTSGTPAFNDPNTTDTFAYAPGNIDGLCKTCHDGWTGTAFPNVAAPDESTLWTSSMHGSKGYGCMTCHTYHSAANAGPLLIDHGSTSCQASGCHNNLTATFQLTGGGLRSHHPIEGGTGIALSCNDCHNPHVAQADPLSTVDPANKTVAFNLPAAATDNAGTSYNAFCLRCHGPTPPTGVLGAKDISTELAGGAVASNFTVGGRSYHRGIHSGFSCMNCHDHHGSSGTLGINRGASLRNFINVVNFPYTVKESCGTNQGSPYTFGCHN